jgi:dephospho-CoA kinase
MLHVGLTGGIGSGKSTVAAMFKASGAYLLDSDKIVRELLRPGREGYQKVIKTFGEEVLRKDGLINRKKLAKIVFNDKAARAKLEKILHPLVIRKRRFTVDGLRKKPGKRWIVISEAALIFEAGTQEDFDIVILVTAPPKTRIRRLTEKGWRPEEIERRMKAQFSDSRKKSLADIVINNGLSMKETEKQVLEIYRRLQAEQNNV